MKKLSQKEFAKYIEENIGGWNAKVGVWYSLYYHQYKDDLITLEQALEALKPMHPYLG